MLENHEKSSRLIKKVYNALGLYRLVIFLKTLDTIANVKDYELLPSLGYINSVNMLDTQRINKAVNFLMENYSQEIKIEEITILINMNKSSFCRYYKSRTHKTVPSF